MPKRSAPYRGDRPTVVELAAGGVVRRSRDGRALLIHEKKEGRWTLPKGHVEAGETLAETALREIAEETGLRDLQLVADLGEVTYRFYDPVRQLNVIKVVTGFVFTTPPALVRLESIFDRHTWANVAQAVGMVAYESERHLLKMAAGLGKTPATR